MVMIPDVYMLFQCVFALKSHILSIEICILHNYYVGFAGILHWWKNGLFYHSYCTETTANTVVCCICTYMKGPYCSLLFLVLFNIIVLKMEREHVSKKWGAVRSHFGIPITCLKIWFLIPMIMLSIKHY